MYGLPLILLTAFRVAFVGDPQVDNAAELEYARKSVYNELKSRPDLDLVVILGDLVNENTSLIAPSEASLDSLSCPWVRVNGNHDCKSASDSSFIMNGIRFILLDNVRPLKKGGYEGGLRESQKVWLDSLVQATPLSSKIVFCTHIPISQSRGRDSLANIIAPHSDVLFVCGHTHCVNRMILERGMEEVQAGASCGTWWRGVKDSDGIPYALMNCGAPRGYFTADFHPKRREWYTLDYKCIGRSGNERCCVTEMDGRIYINVYGGSREGRVKVSCEGKWVEAAHCYTVAPEVKAIIGSNLNTPREYKKTHREEFIPLRRLPSPHVWVIGADSLSGIHKKTGSRIIIDYSDCRMKFRVRL